MDKNILLPCSHTSQELSKECSVCTKYSEDEKFKQLCIKLDDERLNKKMPNIIERGINLGKAAVNYIKEGLPSLLNDAVYENRLETCSSCVDNRNGICVNKQCGCVIAIKAKIPTEDCPAGKWPKLNLPVISNSCGGCPSRRK